DRSAIDCRGTRRRSIPDCAPPRDAARGTTRAPDTARGMCRCSAAMDRSAAPRRVMAGTAGRSHAAAPGSRVRSGHLCGNRAREAEPTQPGPAIGRARHAPDEFGLPTDRRSRSRTTGRTRRNGWLYESSTCLSTLVLRSAMAGVNGGREPVPGTGARTGDGSPGDHGAPFAVSPPVRRIWAISGEKCMKSIIVSVACVVALYAATPANASPASPAGPQAAASTSDHATDKKIEQRLNANASLKRYHLKASVDGGIATLTGTVATDAQKARAGQLAMVSGVTRVDNQI